jgi:hypothetical protein
MYIKYKASKGSLSFVETNDLYAHISSIKMLKSLWKNIL